MSGLSNISIWLVSALVFVTPAMAQGGGRHGGPPPQGSGQRAQGSGQRPPGPHMGDWLRKNLNTPPAQQQKELENDPKFKNLPPQRQEQLKQRLQWFNSLTPEQQQKILQRTEKWEHMTPEQHRQARAVYDRMQTMPDERRNAIRQQMRAFRDMTLDQRQKFINSDQFKKEFSPDERDVMQQWLILRDSNTVSATPTLDDTRK